MTRLELKVEMDEVKRARAFVLSIADGAGLSERQTQNLHLVVEEAVANIVNYSGATQLLLFRSIDFSLGESRRILNPKKVD